MAKRILSLLDSLLLPVAAPQPSAWQPSTDIYRTPKGWLIKFDIAGVRPEDVELTVRGNRLSARGIRRDACLTEDCRCYQMEIAYSQFERHITLPTELEHAHIDAEHHHGMLLVRISLEDDSL